MFSLKRAVIFLYLLSFMLVISACSQNNSGEFLTLEPPVEEEPPTDIPPTSETSPTNTLIPEEIISPTNTPLPTETPEVVIIEPTPITPTVTEVVAAFDFRELAFFGIQPFDYNLCEDASYGLLGSSPQVLLDDFFGADLTGRMYLCLFNFNPYEPVKVILTDPNLQVVDEIEVTPDQDIFGSLVGVIPLSFSLDLPLGTWSADASQGEALAHLDFIFQSAENPFMVVSRKVTENIPSPADPQRTASFKPGETLLVQGVNFTPGIDLPVALMAYQDNVWNNLDGKVVRVSEDGRFQLDITLPPDLPPGSYMIFPLVETFTGLDFQPSIFSLFLIQ
jgi:hypothetical protein